MENEKQGLVAEFKEFISQGSVMDLAVGIIIGAAFTAIVTSLVKDLIMPLVGMALGGVDFSSMSFIVGTASLTYGSFIQAIINFFIIAFVIFMIVKYMNKFRKTKDAEPEIPSEEIALLTEIRDALIKK